MDSNLLGIESSENIDVHADANINPGPNLNPNRNSNPRIDLDANREALEELGPLAALKVPGVLDSIQHLKGEARMDAILAILDRNAGKTRDIYDNMNSDSDSDSLSGSE